MSSVLTMAAPKVPANPGPLGLLGFGLTTLALSSVNAGLLGVDSASAIVPLAFAFGGVAQLIAGVAEFKNGNTFGTVAFTSYGLFWWWFALLNIGVGAKILTPPAAHGVGTILMLWGVLTFGLWIVTFRLNKAVWSIFFLLWITFFLLAAHDFGKISAAAGGYFGLITGADAMIVAFLELLNATAGCEVVSLGKPLVP